MVSPSRLQVKHTKPNEVVIYAPLEAAFEHAAVAVNRLGSIRKRDLKNQTIDGYIKYGLQSVRVHVSLVERVQGETTAVVQASSDDVWGAGAKNATGRLIELLVNLDNPGYQPDRLGMRPAALVGIIIAFVLILLVIFALLAIVYS